MVSKKDLCWTDEDTLAVLEYKRDVEAGRIKPIPLPDGGLRELILNLPEHKLNK